MLQSTRINQVLTQALTAVPLQTTGDTSPLVSPIAVSLLSENGAALSTVYGDLYNLTIDDIKVYSLLVYNYFKNINDGSSWGLLQVDKDTNIAIEPIALGNEVSQSGGALYVVILYRELPDNVAKYKLDRLVEVFQKELADYRLS